MRKNYTILNKLCFFLILSVAIPSMAQTQYTRGIGLYPGRPTECYAPRLVTDTVYRNIAQGRPVYTSSC